GEGGDRSLCARGADPGVWMEKSEAKGEGIWTTTGPADHRTGRQLQSFGELDEVVDPAENGAVGTRVGQPVARAVHREEADARRQGRVLVEADQARTRGAMQEDDRSAGEGAPLRVSKPNAAWQADRP